MAQSSEHSQPGRQEAEDEGPVHRSPPAPAVESAGPANPIAAARHHLEQARQSLASLSELLASVETARPGVNDPTAERTGAAVEGSR